MIAAVAAGIPQEFSISSAHFACGPILEGTTLFAPLASLTTSGNAPAVQIPRLAIFSHKRWEEILLEL
jgi:hypothetical protein